MRDTHIEDDRMIGPCEAVPVKRIFIECVAGGKRYAVRKLAVCQRKPRGGRGAECCGDAGHDHIADARSRERFDFLSTAAKDEWVPALQARHAQARTRMLDPVSYTHLRAHE